VTSALALGLADRVVSAPDPAGGLGVFRGASGDLQPPQLLLGQRGLLVRVILAAGQHAPEQNRQLARGRDDRLAMPAAGTSAVIEGVQRPGLQDDAPGGLDQRPAGSRRAALADPPAACRRLAGLADLGIQAQVAWSRSVRRARFALPVALPSTPEGLRLLAQSLVRSDRVALEVTGSC
jgi:hypothetical protein